MFENPTLSFFLFSEGNPIQFIEGHKNGAQTQRLFCLGRSVIIVSIGTTMPSAINISIVKSTQIIFFRCGRSKKSVGGRSFD